MRSYRFLRRFLPLALCGGLLLQTGGCFPGLIPLVLSVAESAFVNTFLNLLLSGLTGP